MEEKSSLFYPELRIHLGNYTFPEGVSLAVYSNAATSTDWGTVKFTKEWMEKIQLKRRDSAVIELGYDGNFHTIFEGWISKAPGSAGGAGSEIQIQDDSLLLEDSKITATFRDADPHDILAFCLPRAGISDYQLFDRIYPPKKVVIITKRNMKQVLEEIRKLWGIPDSYFFRGHALYFGAVPPQEKMYKFEYGENIISLKREGQVWVMETVSVPFIRHTDQIILDHPDLSGQFQVQKVVFRTTGEGFIRTQIYI